MRDAFDTTPFIGGSGLTLFAFFMALARLLIDPVVDRIGPVMVAVVLLSLAASASPWCGSRRIPMSRLWGLD